MIVEKFLYEVIAQYTYVSARLNVEVVQASAGIQGISIEFRIKFITPLDLDRRIGF